MTTPAVPNRFFTRLLEAETKAWAFDEIKQMFDSGQLVLAPDSDSASVDHFDLLLLSAIHLPQPA